MLSLRLETRRKEADDFGERSRRRLDYLIYDQFTPGGMNEGTEFK